DDLDHPVAGVPALGTNSAGPLGTNSAGALGTNSAGALAGTQRAAYRAKNGPAKATVGMATSTPRPRVMPRLAFSAATATSGPGWGGTNPCMTDSPASAGMPTRMMGSWARRETSTMTGMSSTRPISKNIGRPISAPTNAIAQGSVRALDRLTMVSTIWSAPPESASSRPNIAPRAISVPTLATVDPTPAPKLTSVSLSCTPASPPTAIEPIVSERNGWS